MTAAGKLWKSGARLFSSASRRLRVWVQAEPFFLAQHAAGKPGKLWCDVTFWTTGRLRREGQIEER